MTSVRPPTDENLQLDLLAQPPDGAYDGADQADENAEDHWRDHALLVIRQLRDSGWEFTSDEVRAAGVDEPDHPNRWGGVFLAARRAGWITPTGQVRPSVTPSRHGSLVRVWRGVREEVA
ncbi:MAG: hypothetical protein ACRDQA_02545 [Nocardioidaceae bacterium]